MTDANEQVLIWSGEHHAYWRPDSAGYTIDGLGAGVYTRAEFERIVAGVGPEKQLEARPVDRRWPVIAAADAGEAMRLRLTLQEERRRNRQLLETNTKLVGALESSAPISLTAGSWWYPEGDTSSDACQFSPDEVAANFASDLAEGEAAICVIERAISLPDVYAAVRMRTEAEMDAAGSDDLMVFTLHATREEAEAALAADRTQEAAQ